MEIAYNQILLLLFQCLIVAFLLASLFRLRNIFGLSLLYIALGVFQFLQVFLASSLLVEVASGIFISTGSMVLFSASLFMVLIIYIREDALETRKIIYALFAANIITALLLIVFSWSIDNEVIVNVHNLPREFFSNNARILVVGTVIFIFDALAIIFIYESLSNYVKPLFLRILFTMTLVLSLDSILFALGIFYGKLEFQNIVISTLVSKNLAALTYSSLFTLYLVYFDTKSIKSESESDTFKDIFHKLTFRQKYDDVFTEMKNKSLELQKAQEIAQLGTFNLDLKTMQFSSSPIFDSIMEFDLNETKKFTTYQKTVHPDDFSENQKKFKICIKTGKRFDREYRIFTCKTKKLKWVHGKGEVIYIKGKPAFFKCTLQDITKNKIAEKNNSQYWKIVENSLNEIFIFDAETLQFIEVNRGARNNIGYTIKELLKKTPVDIMPQFTTGIFKELLKPLKNNSLEKIVFISDHQRKDGTTYKAEVDIQKSELKLRPVFIASIKDITQQQKSKQINEIIFNIAKKSNESIGLEELFNFIKIELGKLINTSNFFVALYDEKTEMISTPYMVDELDTLTDFPKGKTLTGHVIDTKKAVLTKDIVYKNTPNNHEVIGLGPESKCWLGVPILIDNQAIGAIVVQSYNDENAYNEGDVILLELVASNIGQIIRKTEDFEHIKLLNQALINTPAIVMITNKKGELEFINDSFTNSLGYKFNEVIGKNPKFLDPKIKIKEFYSDVDKSIALKGYWKDEIINIKKNGDLIRVSASIAPVKDEDDNLSHYIIIEEDITEKRKLERQFINAIIEAQDIEKQSFGEELHDSISQILSAESMYIDLLIDQNQDGNNGETKFLNKIKELNSSAMNETRNIAHGLMSNQLKQSGLLISVENICIDFSNKKEIEFKFVNSGVDEKDLSQEIKTNLYRVIQELSTNINRYSNGTKALIHFSKFNNNNLKIIVKDNGIGMDYDKIINESTGIGLQTVKRRVTYLNGNFDVKSTWNEGTCYTIEIPL